jgi:hypothetical protein
VTPDQIALVRRSFSELAAGQTALAAPFYDRWRELNPSVIERLGLDGPPDEVAFRLEMAELLSSLPDVAGLVERTDRLGRRQAEAGMRASDFSTGRMAFMHMVEDALGSALDPPTQEAWLLATNLIAECLMTAGAEARGTNRTSPGSAA